MRRLVMLVALVVCAAAAEPAGALAPGGYLVLGKVETLVGDVRMQLVIEDARELQPE